MVQVHNIKTPETIQDDSFDTWFCSLVPDYESADSVEIKQLWHSAFHLIQNSVTEIKDLKPFYSQGFEMANTLSLLNVNTSTLIAAILYPFVENKLISTKGIKEKCSATISQQLEGMASMDAIKSFQSSGATANDVEHIGNLRKMLLVMVDDVRVVLIKLAERLYLLRFAIAENASYREELAQEIKDIYAPLANRLGIGQIKWEMEDLTFHVLEPEAYKQIAKSLSEKRVDRETYVDDLLEQLEGAIKPLNISEIDLEGRAKHIYSIWKKMQRKQVSFEEIYDVRAVRVLVPKVQDCYSVLGVVHGLWRHIPKEFDDYIATPKENGYRSLHTAVIGPEGKTLEIQIRTFQMHQESELGVAAHWKYKEGKEAPTDGYEAKIAWLRQLLDWQDEVASSDLVEEFKNQVNEQRIYVFTPQGKLIDLPQGATALDFAYRVHSEIGHRCRGAKANGRIISLTQPLETGQKVEVLTAKTGGPSRDWLNEHQGYIRSSRARHKINQWFRQQDKDKNAAAGKQMLEKELAKQNLEPVDYTNVAKHFNYNQEDELFAGIGVGDKGLQQITNYIRSLQEKSTRPAKDIPITQQLETKQRQGSGDILVEGVGNLLTRIAACCKPVPGDPIAGYVTQSRGIMIHRNDCHYLLSSKSQSPKKVLQVEWSNQFSENYPVDLLIKAYDRKGLLSDITMLMANEKISVTALKTQVNKKQLMFSIHIQIEVASADITSRVMARIEQLPSIVSVQRK
jgi:GTP pyrophosphokinase